MTDAISTRYDAETRHFGPVILTDSAGEITLTEDAFAAGSAGNEKYQAHGIDSAGVKWLVTWEFAEELEDPSDHDWDDVSNISLRKV